MRNLNIILVVFLLLGSCASTSQKPGQFDAAETKVRVDNQLVTSVTVYVLTPADELSLGLVQGMTTRVFTIPDAMVARSTSLRLLADPVGNGYYPISESFSASPGDVIDMVIGPY